MSVARRKPELRLLDLGGISALRSQSLYHALCHGVSQGMPDTVAILYPLSSYVCVGYHQDLQREIALSFCSKRGWPVYKRQVGGGTVYLDNQQLFFQLIFHRERMKMRVKDLYPLFLKAPVETYRRLGLEAVFSPLNEICVKGRKITGSGMAQIDEAIVFVGNLILDFDPWKMASILKTPSEAFREKVKEALESFMTSIQREVGSVPPMSTLKTLLIEEFQKALRAELILGKMSPLEEQMVRQWEKTFLAHEWLYSSDQIRYNSIKRVKIKEGIWVVENNSQPIISTG